jgi:hypothetical protein
VHLVTFCIRCATPIVQAWFIGSHVRTFWRSSHELHIIIKKKEEMMEGNDPFLSVCSPHKTIVTADKLMGPGVVAMRFAAVS